MQEDKERQKNGGGRENRVRIERKRRKHIVKNH